jgi:cell wall-associated NlpC family hydrolase
MRALATAFVLCCALFPASSPAAVGATRSWAQPQIKLVTARKVFLGTPATFRPQDPLTEGTLARVVARLTDMPAKTPSAPATPVSMAGLDHPVGQENLELGPLEPATRAEAAYSVAAILRFGSSESHRGFGGGDSNGHHHSWGNWRAPAAAAKPSAFASSWEVEDMKAQAQAFVLPKLTGWQRRILQTAVSMIGDPYIWGGTTTAGMDCSGFVWRVYKLTSYSGAPQLSGILRGRTTMEMSGEVPKYRRIPIAKLQPGDVLFFGNGPKSKPSQVDHTGIYLGNDWFINSSGYGVAIASLSHGASGRFAWARRPLAEAGLH